MGGNTDKFFELVENTFSVDEISSDKIMDKFYRGSFGRVKSGKTRGGTKRTQASKATFGGQSKFLRIAERLAEGNRLAEDIAEEDNLTKLEKLRSQAQVLDIYSKEVTQRAQVKIEELEIAQDIAEEIEVERQEKIRLQQERQEVARQEKEILREQGIEPDF